MRVLAIGLSLTVVLGCERVAPAPSDASRPPDAASRAVVDGAVAADAWCALDCDDADPCTDDGCVDGACVHAPNEAPCDDGVRCNGADRCAEGLCAVHDGVTGCPRCDPATDTCVGCRDVSECPSATETPFGACEAPAGDACALEGVQTRSATVYTCDGGTCVPHTMQYEMPCARASDGLVCEAEASCAACEEMLDVPTCASGRTGQQRCLGPEGRCQAGVCAPTSSVRACVCP